MLKIEPTRIDALQYWLKSANNRYIRNRLARGDDIIRIGVGQFTTISRFVEQLPLLEGSFDAFVTSIESELHLLDATDQDAVLSYCHGVFTKQNADDNCSINPIYVNFKERRKM